LRDVFSTSADPAAASVGACLRMIEEAGRGVLLYVFPRGRASMLADFEAQLGAAGAQGGAPPKPLVTTAAGASPGNRLRDFGLGAQVLADLGCGKIRLMTNNPRRVVGASGYGLDIVECLPIRGAAKVLPLREQEG
jgi:3,4-dihydroxy 2-butanone 4-phosphate synthase/GTP cyclohydrolase II